MDVRLEPVEGAFPPADTFVSMRVKDAQKQSRFAAAKSWHFPSPPSKDAASARIEVFRRLGTSVVPLEEALGGNRLSKEVAVACSDARLPRLCLKLVAQKVSTGLEGSKKEKLAESERYLKDHQLEEVVTDALKKTVQEAPEQPVPVLRGHLAQSALSAAATPTRTPARSQVDAPAGGSASKVNILEVQLEAADGVYPESDVYLSLRMGDAQKQARFTASKSWCLPVPRSGDASLRIDVYRRLGNVTEDLACIAKQGTQEIGVPCKDLQNSEMKLRLSVSGEVFQAPPLTPGSAKNRPKDQYMKEHNMQEVLSGAIKKIVKEKPENPHVALTRHLGSQPSLPRLGEKDGAIPADTVRPYVSGFLGPPEQSARSWVVEDPSSSSANLLHAKQPTYHAAVASSPQRRSVSPNASSPKLPPIEDSQLPKSPQRAQKQERVQELASQVAQKVEELERIKAELARREEAASAPPPPAPAPPEESAVFAPAPPLEAAPEAPQAPEQEPELEEVEKDEAPDANLVEDVSRLEDLCSRLAGEAVLEAAKKAEETTTNFFTPPRDGAAEPPALLSGPEEEATLPRFGSTLADDGCDSPQKVKGQPPLEEAVTGNFESTQLMNQELPATGPFIATATATAAFEATEVIEEGTRKPRSTAGLSALQEETSQPAGDELLQVTPVVQPADEVEVEQERAAVLLAALTRGVEAEADFPEQLAGAEEATEVLAAPEQDIVPDVPAQQPPGEESPVRRSGDEDFTCSPAAWRWFPLPSEEQAALQEVVGKAATVAPRQGDSAGSAVADPILATDAAATEVKDGAGEPAPPAGQSLDQSPVKSLERDTQPAVQEEPPRRPRAFNWNPAAWLWSTGTPARPSEADATPPKGMPVQPVEVAAPAPQPQHQPAEEKLQEMPQQQATQPLRQEEAAPQGVEALASTPAEVESFSYRVSVGSWLAPSLGKLAPKAKAAPQPVGDVLPEVTPKEEVKVERDAAPSAAPVETAVEEEKDVPASFVYIPVLSNKVVFGLPSIGSWLAARPPQPAPRASPFHLHPSVGTWLAMQEQAEDETVPASKTSLPVSEPQPEQPASIEQKAPHDWTFEKRPSVGSWLALPVSDAEGAALPEPAQKVEASTPAAFIPDLPTTFVVNQPSVGTWLGRVPSKPSLQKQPFAKQPSVGTWLASPSSEFDELLPVTNEQPPEKAAVVDRELAEAEAEAPPPVLEVEKRVSPGDALAAAEVDRVSPGDALAAAEDRVSPGDALASTHPDGFEMQPAAALEEEKPEETEAVVELPTEEPSPEAVPEPPPVSVAEEQSAPAPAVESAVEVPPEPVEEERSSPVESQAAPEPPAVEESKAAPVASLPYIPPLVSKVVFCLPSAGSWLAAAPVPRPQLLEVVREERKVEEEEVTPVSPAPAAPAVKKEEEDRDWRFELMPSVGSWLALQVHDPDAAVLPAEEPAPKPTPAEMLQPAVFIPDLVTKVLAIRPSAGTWLGKLPLTTPVAAEEITPEVAAERELPPVEEAAAERDLPAFLEVPAASRVAPGDVLSSTNTDGFERQPSVGSWLLGQTYTKPAEEELTPAVAAEEETSQPAPVEVPEVTVVEPELEVQAAPEPVAEERALPEAEAEEAVASEEEPAAQAVAAEEPAVAEVEPAVPEAEAAAPEEETALPADEPAVQEPEPAAKEVERVVPEAEPQPTAAVPEKPSLLHLPFNLRPSVGSWLSMVPAEEDEVAVEDEEVVRSLAGTATMDIFLAAKGQAIGDASDPLAGGATEVLKEDSLEECSQQGPAPTPAPEMDSAERRQSDAEDAEGQVRISHSGSEYSTKTEDMFAKYDEDGDGTLNMQQFEALLSDPRYVNRHEELVAYMEQELVERKSSGEFQEDPMDRAGTAQSQVSAASEDLFAKYDEEGDGTLSIHQMEALLRDPAYLRKHGEMLGLLNELHATDASPPNTAMGIGSTVAEAEFAPEDAAGDLPSGIEVGGDLKPIMEEETGEEAALEDESAPATAQAQADEMAGQEQKRQRSPRSSFEELGVEQQQKRALSRSALRVAAQRNDCDLLTRLLDGQADPNHNESEGRTPLFFAAESGAVKAMQLLIARKADVQRRSDSDASLLHLRCDDALLGAVRCGQTDACKVLLESSAAVAEINNSSAEYEDDSRWLVCTPLLGATVAGHADVAKLLLELRADARIQQQDGSGPLHLAVRVDGGRGRSEVLAALLKDESPSKPEVDLQDAKGWTPLLHAIALSNIDAIRQLIRAGASLDKALTTCGTAPDLVAGIDRDDLPVVVALLEQKMDPNQAKVDSSRSLGKYPGMATLTPLCAAVSSQHPDHLMELLGVRADVRQVSVEFTVDGQETHWTPLSLAAKHPCRMEMLDLLLEHRADVNQAVEMPNGYTAMHFAAMTGELAAVEALHHAGCGEHLLGLGSGDQVCPSPAVLARQHGFDEVRRYLEAVHGGGSSSGTPPKSPSGPLPEPNEEAAAPAPNQQEASTSAVSDEASPPHNQPLRALTVTVQAAEDEAAVPATPLGEDPSKVPAEPDAGEASGNEENMLSTFSQMSRRTSMNSSQDLKALSAREMNSSTKRQLSNVSQLSVQGAQGTSRPWSVSGASLDLEGDEERRTSRRNSRARRNSEALDPKQLKEQMALMHEEITGRLKEASASPTKRPSQLPEKPMRTAIERNDGAMVKRLLQSAADPNENEGEGRTPLFFAAQSGAVDAINALIQGGAEVRRRAEVSPNALAWRNDDALTAACQYGSEEAVKVLLLSGATQDINTTSEYKQGDNWFKCNPLLAATMAGHASVTRILLDHGANPSVTQEDGSSPLHCAVRLDKEQSHYQVVVELTSPSAVCSTGSRSRADLEAMDMYQWTPLMHATHSRNIPVIRALIKAGASVAPVVEEATHGDNLVQAIINDQIGLMIALLESGKNPNEPMVEPDAVAHARDGMVRFTPLCAAIRYERAPALQELLDKNADPNEASVIYKSKGKGKDVHCTPLSLAGQQGRADFVQLLLERKANLHQMVEDGKEYTALHFAAAAGQMGCVVVLHRAGCAAELLGPEASKSSQSPAALARARGFHDIAAYLDKAVPVQTAASSSAEPRQESKPKPKHRKGSKEKQKEERRLSLENPPEVGPKSPLPSQRSSSSSPQKTPTPSGERAGTADSGTGCSGTASAALSLVTFQEDVPHTSALRIAAEKNDVVLLKRLLAARSDPNQDDGDKRTPLFPAAQAGAVDAVRALIDGGADVRRRASYDPQVAGVWRNDDALISACQFGHLETCKLLLDAGAVQDIDACSEYTQGDSWYMCTPLLASCMGGQTEVVQLLLDYKANANLKQSDGSGILHCVVRLGNDDGHADVLKVLLSHKGKPPLQVDALDAHGWTPLLHAMAMGNLKYIRMLLEAGASLDDTLKEHPTGKDLVQAVINDDLGLVVALLAAGEDPNQPKVQEEAVNHTEPGMIHFTPLCAAIRHKRPRCATELLEAKADPNKVSIIWKGRGSDFYSTPLSWAAQLGSVDLVQLLLAHSSDINQDVQPPKGYTAMHFAAAVGQFEVVKVLHRSGCSGNLLGLEQGNSRAKPPAALARQKGFHEVAAYLETATPMPCNPKNDPQGLSLHA